MPLERQVRVMNREGLVVDSQTLWDQINALAGHLAPTYEALGARIRGTDVLGADETWWRLMDKHAAKKWWAWCLAVPDAVFYQIFPSRSKDAAGRLLGDFKGVVMCDGYSAYDSLASDKSRAITLAHCWAHARRKFVEVEAFYPVQITVVLDLIKQLYAVESLIPQSASADPVLALELRRKLRATPESGLRKAVD